MGKSTISMVIYQPEFRLPAMLQASIQNGSTIRNHRDVPNWNPGVSWVICPGDSTTDRSLKHDVKNILQNRLERLKNIDDQQLWPFTSYKYL